MNYFKKQMFVALVVTLLISAIGCSKSETLQPIKESSQNSVSEESLSEEQESQSDEVSKEETSGGASVANDVKDGYKETPFAPTCYSFELESYTDTGIKYTLELPENWSVDGDGSEYMAMIKAEDGFNIGQVEASLIQDTSQLFADTDDKYSDISVKQEEFEVNGYPAKHYQLEAGVEGENFTVQQHFYFVAVDGVYLNHLFYAHYRGRAPEVTEKYTEEFFRDMISSLKVDSSQ